MTAPDTYEDLLIELARRDPRIVVLTAENRAAIRRIPAALGDRFIDTGITEQMMVGMGAGLAVRGRIPVMHALAAFLTARSYEFIRTDLGIAGLPGKLVGSVAGVLSEANGPTHQAIDDIAIMRAIPRMGIFCPADTDELLAGLPEVLAHDGPCYIRYIDRPRAFPHPAPFALGRAEVIGRGTDVAILTYGAMARDAYRAAALLTDDGYAVRFVNVRTLAPVDEVELLAAAQSASLVVTVEDHLQSGALYSILAECMVAHRIAAPVLPISLGHTWFHPGVLSDVLAHAQLDPAHLAARIRSALEEPAGAAPGGPRA